MNSAYIDKPKSTVICPIAAIFYHVKRVQISEEAGDIYCLWISRDSEAPCLQGTFICDVHSCFRLDHHSRIHRTYQYSRLFFGGYLSPGRHLNVTYEFPHPKASQEHQRSTAEGRSILGDLASLNMKSVGGEDETEEGESVLVDSGGIDMSLGKASCFGALTILHLPQTSRRLPNALSLLSSCCYCCL